MAYDQDRIELAESLYKVANEAFVRGFQDSEIGDMVVVMGYPDDVEQARLKCIGAGMTGDQVRIVLNSAHAAAKLSVPGKQA